MLTINNVAAKYNNAESRVDHLLKSSTGNSIDPEPRGISYLVVLEPQQIPVRIDLKETSGFVLTELHWKTKFHPTEADTLPTSQGASAAAPGAGQLSFRGDPGRWRRALMGTFGSCLERLRRSSLT